MDDTQRTDSIIGVWILDQYRIVEPLRAGGMGQVYIAEQPSMDRLAAVKILRAGRQHTPETRRRFRQEARAVSRLSHPNVVAVYNFGEMSDGTLFLAMEYVEGENLATLLARGPLPVMRAVNLCYQCAAALGYAHSRSIVHRDLKPENVMVSRLLGRDHVKVLDFGVARVLEETSSTQPGIIMGTPEYLSPEQCRGEKATSFSDQYALGLVFYTMLTGRPVYEADSVLGYLHLHQHAPVEPPSAIRRGANLECLDELVLRMLAKNPEGRFSSMEEIQTALEVITERVLRPAGTPRRVSNSFPVLRLDQSEATRDTGPMATVPAAMHPLTPEPVQLVFLGADQVLEEGEWERLRRRGLQRVAHVPRPEELEACIGSRVPDLWIYGAREGEARRQWGRWEAAGVNPGRTLMVLDGDPVGLQLGGDQQEMAAELGLSGFANLLVGRHPVDPVPLALILRWMARRDRDAIEAVEDEGPVQFVQISSSRKRPVYVESLLDDLRDQGVRRPAQQALRELSDELVMNAVYHAPVDAEGNRLFAGSDRRRAVSLPPGREATMRWVVGKNHVVLSVRDAYGSLSVADILRGATAVPGSSPVELGRGGAGLGLQIMARAADHLLFFVSPQSFCEVVAVVHRNPRQRQRKSLAILQGGKASERQVGDQLWLTVSPDGRRMALRGEINETSDMTALFASSGRVRLDLSQVKAINSSGLQAWVMAASGRQPGLELLLERCSPAFVRQLNMVPALLEGSALVSLAAPYFCERCMKEKTELLRMDEISADEAPVRTCGECGGELELDELPERYFAFLQP